MTSAVLIVKYLGKLQNYPLVTYSMSHASSWISSQEFCQRLRLKYDTQLVRNTVSSEKMR